MENSEKPVIEIVSVTNLNFIDRLNESIVGQLNRGEYFISNDSNRSITLKNKNFTKQLWMNLGVYLAIILVMVVIGFGLGIVILYVSISSFRAISDISNV